jgi:hypothetical protein
MTRDVLPLDASLEDWVRLDGGRGLSREIADCLSLGGGRVTMTLVRAGIDSEMAVGLDCGEPRWQDTLQRVFVLMEATMTDLIRIRRRTTAATKLENEKLRIQAELDDGLRCEFTLGYKAMQELLLDGGEKIDNVRSMCNVERVVVDTRKRTIRIVGTDAAEVARARDMLEVSSETLENIPEIALRMIVGKGGSKIQDIQQRTAHKCLRTSLKTLSSSAVLRQR